MKNTLHLVVSTLLFLAVGTAANAFDISNENIERRLTQTITAEQARVLFSAEWEKEVRMRDVMARPPRMGAGNPVIRVAQEKTSCQGMLLAGNQKVAVPATCLKHKDFVLKKVNLIFSNQRKAVGTAQSTYIEGDMGYILVKTEASRGLMGVPVASVREGMALQEVYGDSMTRTLHQFFNSFGVPFKVRRHRIGRQWPKNKLQVGEPVIFNGKLVALVKEVPQRYGTFWGSVSEDSLAIFRR